MMTRLKTWLVKAWNWFIGDDVDDNEIAIAIEIAIGRDPKTKVETDEVS